MTDTQEDGALPAFTPQDEASRSCTRQTSCKKANCPICSNPTPGTHNVRDLTQELEITPPPKRPTKPSAPPDHFITSITADLQQACLDADLIEINTFLAQYNLYKTTSLNLIKYDRSELMTLVKTAPKLHKDKDSKQMSAEHLYDEEKSTETKAPLVCNLPTPFYPGIQATQMPRVNTTKDKDSKQMSAEHLYVEEKSTETKAPWVCNLPCTIQYLQVQQWGVQHPEIKSITRKSILIN